MASINSYQQGFRGDIADRHTGLLKNAVADSLHQVCLTDTGLSMDEEGIIGAARSLRGAKRSSMGKIIGGACDKILKGEERIQRTCQDVTLLAAFLGTKSTGEAAVRSKPRFPGLHLESGWSSPGARGGMKGRHIRCFLSAS